MKHYDAQELALRAELAAVELAVISPPPLSPTPRFLLALAAYQNLSAKLKKPKPVPWLRRFRLLMRDVIHEQTREKT